MTILTNVPFNMATLRRPSKDKDMIGRFKPNSPCKKHPKHRQSPGVCSLCLRDKLSQLPLISSSSRTSTYSSSVSTSMSSYYSSSASSCASPTISFPFPPTHADSNSVNIFLLSSKQSGVLKSKSMSVVATRRRRTRREGEDVNNNGNNKKRGFWSKLLHPKTKRSMEKNIKGTKLVHTRSLIETMT